MQGLGILKLWSFGLSRENAVKAVGAVGMNFVEQVISAVRAGGKVAGVVFLSCAAVLAAELYFPTYFLGLPLWILPTIRMIAIFTFVTSCASIVSFSWQYVVSLGNSASKPFKKRATKAKLLHLNVTEVAVLSRALAQRDRHLRLNPDIEQAISLQDKGLIELNPYGAIYGNGTRPFEVSNDAWRLMLTMDEFRIPNPSYLLRLFESRSGVDETMLLKALPNKHPAVCAQLGQQSAK